MCKTIQTDYDMLRFYFMYHRDLAVGGGEFTQPTSIILLADPCKLCLYVYDAGSHNIAIIFFGMHV